MRTPSNQSGFSLIEIMVAIVILGVALAGLTGGLTTALQSSKESELQTTAAMYAAGQIELLRATGGLTDGETDGDCGDNLPLYHWRQSIKAAGIDGLHEVQLAIESTHNQKTIYELKTLLFEATDDSVTNTPVGAKDTKSGGKDAKSKKKADNKK